MDCNGAKWLMLLAGVFGYAAFVLQLVFAYRYYRLYDWLQGEAQRNTMASLRMDGFIKDNTTSVQTIPGEHFHPI